MSTTYSPIGPERDGCWSLRAPLRVGGLELGIRTVVLRHPDGRLWVHSPGPGIEDPALRERLASLGPVAWLVAPNWMHTRFLGAWRQVFPDAALWTAPGLAARLDPALGVTGELDHPPAEWEGFVEAVPLAGMPRLHEVVFRHVAGENLILTDIAFNLRPPAGRMTQIAMRLNGAWDRFGPSRLMRHLIIRDRRAFADSLAPVRRWPVRRILPAHGEPVDADAGKIFQDAFAWLD